MEKNKKRLSMWGMILSIVALVLPLLGLFFLSFFSFVAGLVLGIVGRAKEGRNGMSLTAIIISSVSAGLAIVGFILVIVFFPGTYHSDDVVETTDLQEIIYDSVSEESKVEEYAPDEEPEQERVPEREPTATFHRNDLEVGEVIGLFGQNLEMNLRPVIHTGRSMMSENFQTETLSLSEGYWKAQMFTDERSTFLAVYKVYDNQLLTSNRAEGLEWIYPNSRMTHRANLFDLIGEEIILRVPYDMEVRFVVSTENEDTAFAFSLSEME